MWASRAWGNKKSCSAAYILLKREFRQQEGNSVPFPYREHDFPGDGGQKGRKAWALRQDLVEGGVVDPSPELTCKQFLIYNLVISVVLLLSNQQTVLENVIK